MMKRCFWWFVLVAGGCVIAVPHGAAAAPKPAALPIHLDDDSDEKNDEAKDEPQTLEEAAQEYVDAIYDRIEETGDFQDGLELLEYLLDAVAAYIEIEERETFRRCALALRLVQQVSQLDEPMRLPMLRFLRAHPTLAGEIVFAVDTTVQSPARVYTVLEYLRKHRGRALEEHPALTAAICIVHDRPFSRSANENLMHAPDALAIFDYFVVNERTMLHGIRMPVELLKYVVDVTVTMDDMEWARRRYRNNQAIGRSFFEVSYDYPHFKRGAPKRISRHEYNLPNLHQYGGICADQAFFAVSVGKSIGVPTAYTVGRGASMGHAWVGFLQKRNNRIFWNFDTGRYPEYQRVRGMVTDPQTRRQTTDGHISLLAELVNANPIERQQAAAFSDAAQRLRDIEKRLARGIMVPALLRGNERMLRKADVDSQLELIEAGLRISPGYAPGWFIVRDLARTKDLTLKQLQRWSEVLHRLCGERYPAFHLDVLMPMIASVDDVDTQDRLWVDATSIFKGYDELVAELLFARAQMWERAGNLVRAGQIYERIIADFAESGPFIRDALQRAERILKQGGRADLVPELYENAWAKTQKPRGESPFVSHSNWAVVGRMLARKQEEAGNINRARQIRGLMPDRYE